MGAPGGSPLKSRGVAGGFRGAGISPRALVPAAGEAGSALLACSRQAPAAKEEPPHGGRAPSGPQSSESPAPERPRSLGPPVSGSRQPLGGPLRCARPLRPPRRSRVSSPSRSPAAR
ncbi:unnamed protein product [Lepidochelys olivacea]